MCMTMKKWRTIAMNKDEIVKDMILFIEDAERNLQVAKMSNDFKSAKADIVNRIFNELERKVSNEN